jgi:hypothetical protein
MLSAVQFVDKQLADRSLEAERKARKKEKKKEKKVDVAADHMLLADSMKYYMCLYTPITSVGVYLS